MQVFISYAAQDEEWAARVSGWLTRAKIDFFFDKARLFPGDNWQLKIGLALEASEAMVVLISPHYVVSELTKTQLEFALGSLQYEGRVIPVIIKPTQEIPWILHHFQILDFSDVPKTAEKKLVARIKSVAARKVKAEASAHG